MNSIEIPDSDDDILEPAAELSKSIAGNRSSETTLEMPNEPPGTPTNKSSPSSDSTGNTPNHQQVRHRSRKTQHTVRNAAENEIQFEGIPLNDDDKEEVEEEEEELTDNDSIKSIIDNMLKSEDVQEIIQRIANERVRCNFLLATYQLADMNFSLNTNPGLLRYQFRERLKRMERTSSTSKNSSAQQ